MLKRILIEPFGIETKFLLKKELLNGILIEPFGIETIMHWRI